jgi:peptidoglycan/LPS O-acetylase OafA/YrhL
VNARADRFPLFDALRAIAALLVLGFHAAFFQLTLTDSPLRRYGAHLDVGVTVFFLISGFLLYRPFVRARLTGERGPHVPAYAWRRFLRITPAYWVALTLVALWLGLTSDVFSARGIPTYYGFAQIYDWKRSLGGIGQAWTLCVEVSFYAFLPLWAFAMRRLGGAGDPRRMVRQELVALGVLWLASLGYKLWALGETRPDSFHSGPYLQPLPNFLDQFAIGMALAVVSVELDRVGRLGRRLELLRRHDWIPWVFAAVAFWAVSTRIGLTGSPFIGPTDKQFIAKHELYTAVAAGLVVPALFAVPGRGVAGRLLATRVLAYLGLVSYSIYLYHFAVVHQLEDWLGDWIAQDELRALVHAAIALVAATAVASISYYVVERPALRLKRFVSPPAPAERGEATEEPAPAGASASSATAASTTSATSAGWRNRGTP